MRLPGVLFTLKRFAVGLRALGREMAGIRYELAQLNAQIAVLVSAYTEPTGPRSGRSFKTATASRASGAESAGAVSYRDPRDLEEAFQVEQALFQALRRQPTEDEMQAELQARFPDRWR
jgi:hypothetical protein